MKKTVVVTGGARDIGRGVAIRFAQEGYNVVINYFGSEEQAAQTLEEVKKYGDGITVKADVTKSEEIDALYDAAVAAFGKVDVLVNNAGGLLERRTLQEFDSEFFDKVINLNFKSLVFLCQKFMGKMEKGAAVVNLSSQAARDGGGAGSTLYAASKAAVSTFTRAMAKEYGPQGIRINAVCPGLINTTFHDTFTADEVRTRVAGGTPLRREGESKDVADLVYYLASENAAFITGANYDINGGLAFS